jgi:hypothetical protein
MRLSKTDHGYFGAIRRLTTEGRKKLYKLKHAAAPL